jgi:hypothetical protein
MRWSKFVVPQLRVWRGIVEGVLLGEGGGWLLHPLLIRLDGITPEIDLMFW